MKSKVKIRVILILALVLYSLAGAVLRVIGAVTLPVPFAEFITFSSVYFRGGLAVNGTVGLLLYAAGIIFSVLMCIDGPRDTLLPKLVSCTLLVADGAINVYAFFSADGYQWIYAISALLDFMLMVCILIKEKTTGDERELVKSDDYFTPSAKIEDTEDTEEEEK